MVTADTFGVALCTASVVVHKVFDALVNILGPTYIMLPVMEDEMRGQVKHMENYYGFPQAFGCSDGTDILIIQPFENPHNHFFSFKNATSASHLKFLPVIYQKHQGILFGGSWPSATLYICH